jgi:hypothetical protein
MAGELEQRLPFEPPFDTIIVGGSGLDIAGQISFQPGTRTEIREREGFQQVLWLKDTVIR